MSLSIRCFAALAIFYSLTANTFAFDREGVARPDLEYRRLSKPSDTVAALGNDLFGEQVDHYTGQTSFSVTDIYLPGNSSLRVSLTRTKSIQEWDGYQSAQGIGGWDIEIPVLEGIFSDAKGWTGTGSNPLARCSQGNGKPPDYTTPEGGVFLADEYWHGYQLKIPGQSTQQMLLSSASTQNRTTPSRWTTKNRWLIDCLPTLKSGQPGEGFVATAPDGTRYYFDRMAVKSSQKFLTQIKQFMGSYTTGSGTCTSTLTYCYYSPSGSDYSSLHMLDGGSNGGNCPSRGQNGWPLVNEESIGGETGCLGSNEVNIYAKLFRSSYHLMATRVEDKFGNWVEYDYDSGNKLTAMRSNDGRQITVAYGADHAYPVSASANGRTWNYSYDITKKLLTKVTQPDGRSWLYGQTGVMATDMIWRMNSSDIPYEPCYESALFGVVYPQPQAVFTFTITHPSSAQGDFKFISRLQGKANAPNCNYLAVSELSLSEKKISGAGISPAVWLFSYGPENSSTQTKLTRPDGSSDGLPNNCTTMACVTTVSTQISNPDGTQQKLTFGTRFDLTDGQLQESVLSKNGVTLRKETFQYVSKDPTQAGFATKVGLNPRDTLGAIQSEYVLPRKKHLIEQDGVNFSWQADDFDPLFGRPTSITRSSSLGFSKTELVTYHDNRTNWTLGQLASVADVASGKIEIFRNFDPTTALVTSQQEFGQTVGTYAWNADSTLSSVKDANNNVTNFSNYHRGIPQRITYADASFETGVVNDNGWVTSMTDVRNNTTGFAYDVMGRLTTITPPTGDTVAWNSTALSFDKLATAAYGLPAGAWKQTISKGNYRKETFLDAMWRPVVTREYDNSNVIGTQRFTRQAYDTEGRVVFTSYPGKGDLITEGVHTEYDGLGRTTKVMQNSELGLLTSTTEYLSGFKTKTTNPRGFYTLTSYMAWDSPDISLPTRIESAEDFLTEFVRDGFGKTLSVTRSSLSDSSITNSRIYAYDEQQRLCQRTEPESGSTVMNYDAAGNLLWSAPGQTVANANICNASAVPTTARITRTYDVLNRLKTIDVPNSSNDLTYTYAGGLLQTLGNGGVVWNYSYNKLGLPVTETLSLDGRTKVISHRYNANAVEDQLTLPSNLTIAYVPNALGQATQAGTFATNASYGSNGAIRGFNYGNGMVHSTLLNLRGLPAQRTDSLGTLVAQNESAAFDVNGNVLCIRDSTSGNGGHRDMQYDGQDRLSRTYAPHQWWVSASNTYDVLDNIRTSTVGNRKHTYAYNANQRLTKITKPFGTEPSPQSTSSLMICDDKALLDDIGSLSPEGSGTVEPPYTGGGTNPPGGGGNPPGGGGCQFDCGGGGQQQNSVFPGGALTDSDFASAATSGDAGTMSSPEEGSIPEAPITVYQFTQDANGNTISGRNPALFDALNRLTEITGKEKYLYDGHGRRVKTTRTSDGITNYSVYTLSGQLVTEDDARSNKKTDYIQFNGRLVAQRSAALTGTTAQTTTYINSYLHTDSLGSPVAQSNQAGIVTKIERYTPYGEPSDQMYDQGPGYTGHVTDSLTGLTYAQQRYYDPVIGRFLSVDPIESDTTTAWNFNRYNYAANNPYRYTDPDGQQPNDMGGEAAELGIHLRIAIDYKTYRNMPNGPEKALQGRYVATMFSVHLNDGRTAQRLRLEADTIDGAPAGVIYLRINPKTGEAYVGQAASPKNFVERQNVHDAKLGVQHDYEILERAKPGQQLDVAEESHIRLRGGLKGRREDGGGVVNRRHQMRDPRYRGAGGIVPPPAGTRTRRR